MTVSRYLRDPVRRGRRDLRAHRGGGGARLHPEPGTGHALQRHQQGVGILIPSLSNQVFSAVIHGIEAVTRPPVTRPLLAHYGYSPGAGRGAGRVSALLQRGRAHPSSDTQHTGAHPQMIATAGISGGGDHGFALSPIDMVVGMDHRAAARPW